MASELVLVLGGKSVRFTAHLETQTKPTMLEP